MYNQSKIEVGEKQNPITKGVIQGGILSPKLFNIFYNTLLERLEKHGIFIMAYADDIVLAMLGRTKMKQVI